VNGRTLPTPYSIEKEFEANPLLMFRAYRLSKNFPFHLITHPAVTNRIDPNLPLCPYMLNGRCADAKCPWWVRLMVGAIPETTPLGSMKATTGSTTRK
jgi:hypothetical protein